MLDSHGLAEVAPIVPPSLVTLRPAHALALLALASALGLADATRGDAAKRIGDIVGAVLPGTTWLPADESLPLRNAYMAAYDLGTLRRARILEAECFGMPRDFRALRADRRGNATLSTAMVAALTGACTLASAGSLAAHLGAAFARVAFGL